MAAAFVRLSAVRWISAQLVDFKSIPARAEPRAESADLVNEDYRCRAIANRLSLTWLSAGALAGASLLADPAAHAQGVNQANRWSMGFAIEAGQESLL
jgi:hypothetical protein